MQFSELAADFKGRILIVDDKPGNLHLLSSTLAGHGYDVRCAKNGHMALMGVEHDVPNLILLDIRMPDMNGYEVCEVLKGQPHTAEIPIIFLSASNEVSEKLKAFEVGGVDYITKPFEISEVLARVKTQISFAAAKLKVQTLNAELERRVQERTAELEKVNTSLEQEISDRIKAEKKLQHDALHDALTHLPNRSLFMNRVDQTLRLAHSLPYHKYALLFIDLDRFKVINDSLGHQVGDQLLVSVAKILQSCVRDQDTVARLGGDEFTILLEEISDISVAVGIAERIQEKIRTDLLTENPNYCTSASIGIVLGTQQYHHASELLRDADLAMYKAKESGKAQYSVFNIELHKRALRRLVIEKDLRLALQKQELMVYYQPILSLKQNRLIGFESLLRWKNSKQGVISAGEFIPVAEDSGLIVPIGEWVLLQSCLQLKSWHDEYPRFSDLSISVNLSSRQFYQGNLIAVLDRTLEASQLNPQHLKVEITESLILEDNEKIRQTLLAIRERGVKICLDDFGTGYSSLSYLHRFPIDVIKIDQSFIKDTANLNSRGEIVRTIIELGHSLGMQIVAEGIETEAQAKQLLTQSCEMGQGYYFAQPLNEKAVSQYIIDELYPIKNNVS
ncbi:MAG: EAL domain-containing protein [Cyanobacteria bacterium P01_F01_bin.42]